MPYREPVYVCSPLRGTQAQRAEFADAMTVYHVNLARAMRRCRELAVEGYAPFAPHIYCPRFLDDREPKEREAGIAIGHTFLAFCSRMFVDSTDGVSEGMAAEIKEAETLNVPVIHRWR